MTRPGIRAAGTGAAVWSDSRKSRSASSCRHPRAGRRRSCMIRCVSLELRVGLDPAAQLLAVHARHVHVEQGHLGKGSPAARGLRAGPKAARPVGALPSTGSPRPEAAWPTSSRLVSLSSTTRTRSPVRWSAAPAGTVAGSSGWLFEDGGEPEGGALAFPALHPDAARPSARPVAWRWPAPAGAAILAGGGAVHLGEGGEEHVLSVGRDADAGVADRKAQP